MKRLFTKIYQELEDEEFQMVFLKINRHGERQCLISNLFHLVSGKKGFLENLYFVLRKGKSRAFLVVHKECLMEIELKRY